VPTYQYACTECGEQLERVQKFSDDPLTVCPSCDGRLRKVFSPVGIVFKGSGFYRTDSRSSNGSMAGGKDGGKDKDKDKAEASGKSDSSSDKSSTKSDSSGTSKDSSAPSTSGSPGKSGSTSEKVA
jgi:putative FmdB family regulatory protein